MIHEGYLDHAATAVPKAPGVIEAVASCLRDGAGNPGRGGHRLTVAAARILEEARERVARLLGGHPERTILGSGATLLLNTVLHSLVEPGSRVVTSALEHNAVMRPLRHFERSRGATVEVVAAGAASGVPSPGEVAAAVASAPTRVVVLCHGSNVTGAVLPVAAIARAVAPVPVVVDGAQVGGSAPVDFASLGVAAWACSGHKGLLGPPGIGVLLLAPQVELEPLVRGGTGSSSEREEMPELLPDRLEAGTPNVVGAAGLAAACRWLEDTGVAEIHRRVGRLTHHAASALASVPGVSVQGLDGVEERIGVLSFTVHGVDLGELAAWLDREHGLMLRAGLHCAPAAHRRLGTFPNGTLRVGIGPFTSQDALDRLVEAVSHYAGALPHRADPR